MTKSSRGLLIGVDYDSELARYRGSKVARLVRAFLGRKLDLPDELYIDMYYLHYLPAPILRVDGYANSWYSIARKILESDAGRIIRSRTILDSFMSIIVASILISRLSSLGKKEWTPSRAEISDPMGGSAEVDRALEEIAEDINNIYALRNIAEGLNPGRLSIASFERYTMGIIKLARRADVSEILRTLRGLRESDILSHRKPRPSRRGMKTGYELGSDLERLASRSMIHDDDVFYFKLAEGKLVLYSKAHEKTRGPIYLLVDKSGSMDGDKILWAKALSISIIAKAIRVGRRVLFRYFDSQPHELRVTSGRISPDATLSLIDYIASMKNAGGTDISRALITAISDIKRDNLTECNVILITDGIDNIMSKPIRRGLKDTGSRLYTVMIKGHNDSLKAISDEYFQAVKLVKDELIRVVKTID